MESTDEGEKGDTHLQQINRVIHGLNKRKEDMLARHQANPEMGSHIQELQEIESQLQDFSESKRSLSQRPTANQFSCLAKVNWLRVVLDEAHIIKERTTKTAKAVFLLNAQKRWCMTGTPIQNKVEDLYSLVRFLQVPQYQEPQYWSSNIARPLKHNDCRARERLQSLLSDILLRRTKCQKEQEGLAALVPLPAKVIQLRTDAFRSDEQDFYNALENESRVEFDSYVAKGTVLQNYASILQLILRLRQACGHPQLVVEGRRRSSASENRILNPVRICCACDEEMEQYWGSQSCSHLFCQQCVQYYQRGQDPITEDSQAMFSCPLCCQTDENVVVWKKIPLPTQPIPADQLVSGQPWRPSTKICALLQELHRMWKEDPEEKAIVFSQWTSMLDHVQRALHHQNIRYSRLDGSMTSVARDRSQGQFTNDPKTNVFLISLKAGGQGLNLVCASRVFLLDPWWNPATEAQAIDRVHRMGQKRPVFVTRFVIQGTIEERILKLQQKKSEIAQSTIDGAANRSKKRDQALRFQELQLLLNS
uniref:Uncharacterized protein n=1 Tax=Paramoeba aestuarina TaxID=180227 RepID=A0A7S4NGY3_9EUKA|mmetsp:Transcript_16351/g.25403  ORF Transcript_16351/g.25403 Transcript_16351/m.25403 type:complete len:535 (+) Transcript_16351:317-1921(+)